MWASQYVNTLINKADKVYKFFQRRREHSKEMTTEMV